MSYAQTWAGTFSKKVLSWIHSFDSVLEDIFLGEPGTPARDAHITMPPVQTANGQKMYAMAKSLLGHILAADNAADGYGKFGCAESVNAVALKALGHPIGGGASTSAMYVALRDPKRYQPVTDPLPGDIVICPTGMSSLGPNLHGHVGIVGKAWYMSNDSETATWEANYTRDAWEKSFAARGFATHYFRVL